MAEDPAGLCGGCRHGRTIENSRGSVFQRCERARTDPRLTAYPPLPVRVCPGYEARQSRTPEDKPAD